MALDSDTSVVEWLKSDICTEERLAQLQNALQSFERGTPRTKIQRVPHYLRENQEFCKYYSTKLMSVGPIHHDKENLKLGEQYKLLWTAMYLKEISREPEGMCHKIKCHIKELKDLYTEDVIKGYNDKDLVWMLFVDGCFVLQFMETLDVNRPEKLGIKLDQQEQVVRDLQLLESQIPYKVLELCWVKDEDALLNNMLNLATGGLKSNIFPEFGSSWSRILLRRTYDNLQMFRVNIGQFARHLNVISSRSARAQAPANPSKDTPPSQRKPNHLLDYVRSLMFEDDDAQNEPGDARIIEVDEKHEQETTRLVSTRYKNIRDLIAAGILVEREKTLSWSKSDFVSRWLFGVLKLPLLLVDDSTPYIYLNLVAYEMCPDFHNKYEFSSYLAFLDSLIDDANDVKELRSAGVILNLLGSNEEVAKLFNGIGGLFAAKGYHTLSSDRMAYGIKVKYDIEKHYTNKWKTWLAQAYNTHFSNPWSAVAFFAAALALLLTAVQTYLTIRPIK